MRCDPSIKTLWRGGLVTCLALVALTVRVSDARADGRVEISAARKPVDKDWSFTPKDQDTPLDRARGVHVVVNVPPTCLAEIRVDDKAIATSVRGASIDRSLDATALAQAKTIALVGKCDGAEAKPFGTWRFAGKPAGFNPVVNAERSDSEKLQECKALANVDTVRGPLVICTKAPVKEGGDSRQFRGARSFPAGEMPPAVAELMQIFAEIAVDKAKRKGFDLLRKRIQEALCTDPDNPQAKPKLPKSCAIIDTVRLEDLGAQAQALQGALVADLLTLAFQAKVNKPDGVDQQNIDGALAAVQLTASLLKVHFQGGHLRATLPDPKLLLDQLLVTDWSLPADEKVIFETAVKVTRRCLANGDGNCDVATVLAEVNNGLSVAQHSQAIDMIQLLVGTALAVDRTEDVRERWRLGIQAMVQIIRMAKVGNDELVDAVRDLMIAIVDEDLATAISRGTTLIVPVDKKFGDEKHKRAIRVISTMGAYAATYRQTSGGTDDDNSTTKKAKETSEKDAHVARKKLIENLVDDMTDRRGREEDRIWSLGVDVAFVAGGQWLRNASGRLDAAKGMAPQISLPFGVSYDIGLAKAAGIHFMIFPIDLGQFAAYSSDKGINKPRWDSFLAAGGQIGFVTGQETPFVIALDVRYAPSLFAQISDGDLANKQGGALRIGASIGYYVPFFDFN